MATWPLSQGTDHDGTGRAPTALLTTAWLVLLGLSICAPAMGAWTIAHSERLPGAPSPWALFALSAMATAALALGSWLLFWKRRADPVALLLAYAYLATGASLHFTHGTTAVPKFEELRLGLEVLGIICTTIAMLRFPNGSFQPRWTRFALLPLFAWGAGRWLHLFADSTNALLSIGIMVFSIAAVVLRYIQMPQGSPRQQVRWALFGFAIGLALNVVAVILFAGMAASPPKDVASIWLAARALNSLFLIVMALGLLVSILKYRLYDIDTVISRSAAYAVLTMLLLAVFAASEKMVEMFSQQWLRGSAGAVTASAAAAVVAVLASPLHARAQSWAQRRFQKNLVHLRRAVPECAADLRETATPGEVAAALLQQVGTDIRARQGAVLLGGEVLATQDITKEEVQRWRDATRAEESVEALDCDRNDRLFPIRMPLRLSYAGGERPVGWFLLGPRPDGSFYGSEERQTLSEVASSIAHAISVAALRERRWQASEEKWVQLSQRLSALEARVTDSVVRDGTRASDKRGSTESL